ncbi:hypothetical protein BJV77DRAFT_1068251 [Russula vinacea]|nr:hypothetical protein BJV77DRAFT_1068251 [Russula vinacea]
MSSTAISKSQRLRIAVGLAALKFKPPEQSVQTYTLELKYHFCRSATISISEECDTWHKRALELQAELDATRAAAATVGETKPTPSASKRKRNKRRNLPIYRRRGDRRRWTPAHGNRNGQCRAAKAFSGDKKQSLLILHALDNISAQISTKPAPPPEAALLAAATIRCLEVLHALLARAISPVSCAPKDPTPRDALESIECALPDILRTTVPYLRRAYIHPSSVTGPRWRAVDSSDDEPTRPCDTTSALDLVLGRVTTEVLLPAIRALVPCTLAKTEHILASVGPGAPKKDFADGAQLLSLIGAVLDALPDPKYVTLYDRVALEAVRALTSLIVERPSQVPYSQQTPTQRMHRIARKDALHFLCDTALLAFRRSAPALRGNSEELLRVALADALGDLALTQSPRGGGHGSGLDIVEEDYVMAVLERAWSVGIRDNGTKSVLMSTGARP